MLVSVVRFLSDRAGWDGRRGLGRDALIFQLQDWREEFHSVAKLDLRFLPIGAYTREEIFTVIFAVALIFFGQQIAGQAQK